MYFDYFIVLVFVAAGGIWHLARRPAKAADAAADVDARGGLPGVLVTCIFTAAIALIFPLGLVLHDCLHDSGPAQSLGIGAAALLELVLFAAILLLGALFVRKSS